MAEVVTHWIGTPTKRGQSPDESLWLTQPYSPEGSSNIKLSSKGNIAKVTKGLVEKVGQCSPMNGLATYEMMATKTESAPDPTGIESTGET